MQTAKVRGIEVLVWGQCNPSMSAPEVQLFLVPDVNGPSKTQRF